MKGKADVVFILIAILLLFTGGVASIISNRGQNILTRSESDPVKVGAIIPLEASPQSKALQIGIKLAQKDIEIFSLERGLPAVEVVIKDSQLDPQIGKQVAEELVSQGVDAIYSSHTAITQEVTGVSKENRVPLFYDSCNCGFAEENPLAFQMYFDPRKECREIAEDFKDRGAERAAFIGQDVPYGEFCYGEVQKVFGDENVEIELENSRGLKNYRALLSKWDSEGVEVVFSIPAVADFAELFNSNFSSGANLSIACFEGVCLEKNVVERTQPEALENVIGFGFEIDTEFEKEVLSADPEFERADLVAAAVSHDAIVHSWYLVSQCGGDAACMQNVSQRADYPTAVISNGFGADNILIYQSRR